MLYNQHLQIDKKVLKPFKILPFYIHLKQLIAGTRRAEHFQMKYWETNFLMMQVDDVRYFSQP